MTHEERIADEEARRLLHEAADYIELYGWVQGHFFRPEPCSNPSACMNGAILKATPSTTDPVARMDASERVAARVHSVIGQVSIASWNDEEGRTKQEVVQALRDAANKKMEDE